MRPERTVVLLCWWVATLAAQDSDATGHRGPPSGEPSLPSSTVATDVIPSFSFLDLPYGFRHSSHEKDIAAVFNKVASGGATSTVSDFLPPNTSPRTSPSPQTTPPTTTRRTTPPPSTQNLRTSTLAPPPHQDLPAYFPVAQRPPPPEYTNTFGAILRSSSAENSHGAPGTPRTVPPPLPPPPESDRIPERPQPDFPVHRKKPLNTPAILSPSRSTLSPHMTYSDGPSTFPPFGGIEGNSRGGNDTEINIVPILQNPSITRILSGSNGSVRRPGEEAALAGIGVGISRLPLQPVEAINRDSITHVEVDKSKNTKNEPPAEERPRVADVVAAPPPAPPVRPAAPPPQEKPTPTPEKAPEVHPGRASTRRAWVLAWDIHVYLTGTLFALLALRSLVELLLLPTVPPLLLLLPRGYSVALNLLLLIVGVLRSVFLLHDAYNIRLSYPLTLSYLLLDAAFPCLASAFAVLFLSLLRSTGVRLPMARLQTPASLALMAALYLGLCVGVDVTVGSMPVSDSLLLICQGVAVLWSVALSLAYLYAFGAMSRLAAAAFSTGTARQGGSGQSMVSNRGKVVVPLPERPKAVALAVRITLGTALLGFLMAAILIYGMFGVHGIVAMAGHGNRVIAQPWPWWGYHFSLRVIEISMCLLMSFVGTLRVGRKMSEGKEGGDGWPLLSYITCSCCSSTAPTEVHVNEDESADDSYPAICGVNQTVGKFSLGRSTGKNVYDDSYAMPPHSGGESMPSTTPSESIGHSEGQHIGGRMSGTTTLTPSSEKHHASTTGHDHSRSRFPGSRSGSQTLGSTRSCPSSSMLFAENGFVRFRTSADPEQPMEEVLQQSARKGCPALQSNVLPKSYDDDDEISYKSIDEDVKKEESKRSHAMLINRHRHAPVPDVAEVHLEHGLAAYRPRGGSDASSQAVPNVDSSLSKYASTCSSESATNSFEVRTFPAGGDNEEAAGPVRRPRPRPEHPSHHYLHHHHPGFHHHNHPLLSDDSTHIKARYQGEARGGWQKSMGSRSRRQPKQLPQRPNQTLCPSHERSLPLGVFSQPHRSLPPAAQSPSSNSPTCHFLEQPNQSQCSSSTSSSCCGPDTNYEDVTRAEDGESSDSLSSTHSLPSDSSSSPSVSLHQSCQDSHVPAPLDLCLFQSYQNENVEDPVGSQDVTPDSAVVADIGDGWSFVRASGSASHAASGSASHAAAGSREMDEPHCPMQTSRPTPRSLLNKLRGSNFSLNGYSPLGTEDASLTPVRTPNAAHQVCRSEAHGAGGVRTSSAVFRPPQALQRPSPNRNPHSTDRSDHNLHYNDDLKFHHA